MSDLWSRKYQEYRCRCTYCGKHLFTDFDTFMGSTLDHIIPKRADPPLSEAELESEDNRALACATCSLGRMKRQRLVPARLDGDEVPVYHAKRKSAPEASKR